VQRDRRIRGHYDRQVTIRSKDGRPFKCNNALYYSNRTRFFPEGEVRGGRIHFREVSYRTSGGACESGRRELDQYTGSLDPAAQRLTLSWGRGAQVLTRRY